MWIDDQLLKRCNEKMVLSIWVPTTSLVVLGSSNDPKVEVHVDRCEADGVPIFKRYGGGGTVLLHSGCVVISVGTWLRQPYQNKKYFDLFNRTIIAGLERISTNFEQVKLSEKFGQRGLSDITYGDKKVGGTSLFRSRNYSLYQASLLVDSQLPLINKYLCHPSREPDYRRGRSHAEFLGSLSEVIAGSKAEEVAAKLSIFLPEILGELGKEEIIEPQEVQFGHLLQRAAGAFS